MGLPQDQGQEDHTVPPPDMSLALLRNEVQQDKSTHPSYYKLCRNMKTRSYHLLNMLFYHAMPTKDWELLRRPGIPVEVITGQVEDHLLKALFICRRFK